MDFRKLLVIPKSRSKLGYSRGIVVYLDNQFMVRVKGKHIPIHPTNCTIKVGSIIYSTPLNLFHDWWTSREVIVNADALNMSDGWSLFKPRLKVKGHVINGEFHIIW